MSTASFIPLRVAILTVSDTRTLDTDESGNAAAERIAQAGHVLSERVICTDDVAVIRARIQAWSDGQNIDVGIVTGGTGITLRDVTPEAIAPLVTKDIPGFGELFRMLSYAEIGASTIQSRALAALCGNVIVFALPGSPGAVRLALDRIVVPQLDSRTRPCNFATLLPRIR